ncbi:unnamed protein product [Allacma fusca]|uniref:Equilibrative nucleoside transporter 1 n=1 Tax=Allacma fusca TaxID=39272 RepID=A0A8J2JVE1_9HEXA|nr:unnamed protein product [Allacma fusca]
MSSDNNLLGASIQVDEETEQLIDDSDVTRLIPGTEVINDEEELPSVDVVLPPKDRYWAVYLIFYFLGITTLVPWNFFTNADKYWMYKFRELSNETMDSHGHLTKTHFQASFFSYLSIASNVPSTFAFLANTFLSKWFSSKSRILVSLTLTFFIFVLSTALVQVDTDSWQGDFFILTMVTVVLMNSLCSLFQCGLLQVISHFPGEYTTATMSGQALGGIFAAVANIVSIFLAADQITSAFLYFLVGSLCLLNSLICVIYIPRCIFYKFYLGEKGGPFRWVENYPPEAMLTPRSNFRVDFKEVFKKVWIQGMSAMMIFVVTLAVFPTLMVLVVSEEVGTPWSEKYYIPVVTFLVFSIGDYFGRILSGALKLPSKKSYWTLVFAFLRIGFVPMIMTCNLHPRHYLPVVFKSDIEFTILSALFGLTNGYLANIVFINAPQLVRKEEQEEASSIITLLLGLGLSIGVTLSYFLIGLI